MADRKRMIFEMPAAFQMAIRLQAIKSGRTTGEVVEAAVRKALPTEMEEAQRYLKERVDGRAV